MNHGRTPAPPRRPAPLCQYDRGRPSYVQGPAHKLRRGRIRIGASRRNRLDQTIELTRGQALLHVFEQTLREESAQSRLVTRLATLLLVPRFVLTESLNVLPQAIDADAIHRLGLDDGRTPLPFGKRLQREVRGD